MSNASKHVIVTGGLGYVGSHVAAALLREGFSVHNVDNETRSQNSSVVEEYLTTCAPGADILYSGTFLPVDVLDQALNTLLWSVSEQSGPENVVVVHCAGLKSVAESNGSVGDRINYYRNNVQGTIHLVDHMETHGINKLVFSSSASVYGEHWCDDSTDHLKLADTRSIYARTKLISEQIIRDCVPNNLILRYFNPVGSVLPLGDISTANVMAALCESALNGKLFTVYGDNYPTRDGSAIRDYVHIEDLVQAHVSAVNRLFQHAPGIQPLNIGTERGTTVYELIDTFEKATGKKVNWTVGDRRSGDVPSLVASSARARSYLNWNPVHTLEDACLTAYQFWSTLKDTK